MASPPAPPRVLTLCADLFFTIGIQRTAEGLGLSADRAEDLDDLVEKARAPGPALVLMELDQWKPGAVKRLRDAHGGGLRILAFGSHVDRETLGAAEREGCDAVMPRSAFARDVAGHIRTWTADAAERKGER